MSNNNLNSENINLYQILEVEPNATIELIRKSYKKLSLKFHPDKIKGNLSEEQKTKQFIKIKDAYEILSDPDKRQKYDRELLNKKNTYCNLNDILYDLKNILTSKEYIIFMDILDNKIKQSLLSNTKIDNLLVKINEMNFLDILKIINNFKILDIEINLDFTLNEFYNIKYKNIKYNRLTNETFEEIIFPIDSIQIYENEGEKIQINQVDYFGNFIVHINIINTFYNEINYQILNNDLYASITKKNYLYDNLIIIKFLDDKIHKINITKIDKIITDFGLLYCIPNFGLPYYDTKENIIDTQQSKILRGKLFLLLV